MKKLEIIDSFGDTIVVEPELGLYTTYDFMGNKMPGLGIELYSYDEDGFREPYATLTVNFGEFLSVKDCAYIDTNNNSFTDQLLLMGFCSDTGLKKKSGFCEYPLWKFDKDFLKVIDVNGLYDMYSRKYDNYIENGPDLPVYDRADEILNEVLSALGVVGVELAFSVADGEVEATINEKKLVGAELYRYLLAEVCEYEENGVVKGLDLDLCHDFYDLCEHNEVNVSDYNKTASTSNFEYVITMSSGGGTVLEFMTCTSKEEAEETCEQYGWEFKDENDFVWNLNIDEREVSREMRYTDYGEQLLQQWSALANVDIDNDTFDGTYKYEDRIHTAEDAAGWCLLTYGTYALGTVDEWIKLDHATEAWGINVRAIMAVLENCLTDKLRVSLDGRLTDAAERSEKTDSCYVDKTVLEKE